MSNAAPIKPTTVPDGSVWDAAQQLWVGPSITESAEVNQHWYTASERHDAGLPPLTPFKAERLTDRQLAEETYRVLCELHQGRKQTPMPADGVSEFERGVREGVLNALAYFKDENGHAAIDGWSDDDMDRVQLAATREVLDGVTR